MKAIQVPQDPRRSHHLRVLQNVIDENMRTEGEASASGILSAWVDAMDNRADTTESESLAFSHLPLAEFLSTVVPKSRVIGEFGERYPNATTDDLHNLVRVYEVVKDLNTMLID